MHPITVYRRAKGLTQGELALAVGVSLNSVQSWEKGAGPRARYIPRLAEALGVDATSLVREIEDWKLAYTQKVA